MSRFRDLLADGRQRALLQATAVFAASSWVVLQVLDVLINNGIVPTWVFRGALILLLVGLPVVLVTSFVQASRAAPASEGGSREPTGQPAHGGPSPGGEVSSADGVESARESPAHQRLFTWRNAVLGGVGAFTLLGFASVGYMGLRAMGVGPFGTLLAKGLIEEGAQVVVADFGDGGGDGEMAGVVKRALLIDLMQSPLLRVLDGAELREPLARMQVADGAPVTAEVATQLAQREAYALVIAGDIAPLGTGWLLTASIHGGDGFERLAGFRETARDDGELVDAVERLSRSIRDRVGESLRSVRTGPPLAQVTTASLPALRAYTRGVQAEAVGDTRTALAEFERAVTLDSTFAMAHRKISVALGNLGERPADMRQAARRAWELSERLPPRERHLATGYYHQRYSGDVEAALRAFESALMLDSSDVAVRNNLAVTYRFVGRHEDAVRHFSAAVQQQNNWVLWYNLAFERHLMGDIVGALATLDSATAALPGWNRAHRFRALFQASAGDLEGADASLSALEAVASTALERTEARQLRYALAANRGRVAEAEQALDAPGAELFMADPAYLAVARARLRLLAADTAAAVALAAESVTAAIAGRTDARELDFSALLEVLVEAGALAEARRTMELWDRTFPRSERGIESGVPSDLWSVRMASLAGDHAAAMSALEALLRAAGSGANEIQYALGRVHDAAGRTDLAVAAYEAWLAQPEPLRAWDFLATTFTLRRLAELHEAAGRRAKALEYLARFAERWQDADAELQGRVAAARAALAAM